MSKKQRDFAFTCNNYKQEHIDLCHEVDCEYIIYGKEEAPTTGTPHLQGYVYFKNPRTEQAVRKQWNGFSIAHRYANSSPQAASDYCKKSGNEIYERGTLPIQGKRNDIDEVKRVITETNSMREVVNIAYSVQHVRMAEIYLKYHEKPRNWLPHVEWYYGGPGTGKSRTAYEKFEKEDYYVAMSSGKWFEGYDAHPCVIIDDIRSDFMSYQDFLKLIDRYEFRVQTKGGSRQFLAKHIIITCPYHPKWLWDTREDKGQLMRRIHNIQYFEDKSDSSETI